MLKQNRIPTPLILDSERLPVPIVDDDVSLLRGRRLFAVWSIRRWLFRTFVRKLTGRYQAEESAHEVRTLFETLGGLWIKVGQLVSLRADVIPIEYCRQLSLLQHRSAGFSPALARKMIEAQLGGPIEQFFSEFDDHPFAAASISQVHRGRLKREDIEVAIKVQRPDVELIFKRDLDLLRGYIALLRRLHVMPHMAWDELMWEIDQIVLEEVDYRYEASNIRRVKKSLKDHKVYVPKVYETYSSKTVLTMEFIHGVLMSEYISVRESDPQRLMHWLQENNIKANKLGRRLLFTFLRQMMEDNLFHADLHPGNIVLLRGSRFALIDLGSVGSMQKQFLQRYLMSFRAMAARDYAKAADLTFLMSPHLPVVDLAEVKEKIVRAYRAWEARANLKNLPYHEKSLVNAASASGRILFEYRIVLSWAFMKISRTWATLDASLNYLIPDANYVKLFQRYFVGAERRAVRRALTLGTLKDRLGGAMTTVTEYADLITPILRRQALVFQGVMTKASYFFGVVFRLLKFGMAAATLFFTYVLLKMYQPSWVSGIHNQLLTEAAEEVPAVDWSVGLIALAVMLYLYWLLSRLQKRFRQKEIGIPGSGSLTNA
jgi:ubiquinone biosynthesis protein